MLAIKCTYHCLISLFISCAVRGHHAHRHETHNQHYELEQGPLISTKELRRVSEEIFDMLPDDTLDYIFINYQGQRDSKDIKDEAPEPLLSVSSDLFETMPTIHQMRKLYDNYDMNTQHAEIITLEEDMEEDNFIDELLNTSIMIHAMDFLASKGYFKKNLNEYRHILKKIWFQPYSRNNRTELGSSGFEHVFLVEKKKSYITGLHNWIFFATAEYDDKANYLGYIVKEELANKAVILKLYLSYMEKVKLSSMFIGTPPEFEIALYTLCFYARPNKACKVLLGNVKVTIQTWVQYSNNEQLIGSSFPKIYSKTHKYL